MGVLPSFERKHEGGCVSTNGYVNKRVALLTGNSDLSPIEFVL